MRTRRLLAPALATLFGLVACGGRAPAGGSSASSGFDDGRPLVGLSSAEVATLCAWSLTLGQWATAEPRADGSKVVACDSARPISAVRSSADLCAAAFAEWKTKEDCVATVGDFERCEGATSKDVCSTSAPQICTRLVWGCYAERSCKTDSDCGARSRCVSDRGEPHCRLR